MSKTEQALGHLYRLQQSGMPHANAFRATIAKFGFSGANAQRLSNAYEAHEAAVAARGRELENDPFHPRSAASL